MPTKVDREKRLARSTFREQDSFPALCIRFFLEYVNARPDPDLSPTDYLLWELCSEIAEQMQEESQRARGRTRFDDAYFCELRARLRDIEADEAATRSIRRVKRIGPPEDQVLLVVKHAINGLLDPDDPKIGAPFRCICRCVNDACKQWFFALDDRQIYCTVSCRESRQPAKRHAAVIAHRVRKRQRL